MRETTGRASAEPFLKAIEIDAAETAHLPDGLHQILRGALDVLVVRGAFPDATMRRVVDTLRSGGEHGFVLMPQEDPDIQREQIVFYGDAMSHNSVEDNGPPMARYLEHAAQWRAACRELFASGEDYEARIADIFRSLAGGRAIDVPRYADGRSYCPSTIRMIPPRHGAPFHIDNYFDGVEGWKYLSDAIDIAHPVNFFTTMVPAECGGEIEIFELRFNDPRAPADSSIRKDPSAFAYQAFPMASGDLFILPAGASGTACQKYKEAIRAGPSAGSRPSPATIGPCSIGGDPRALGLVRRGFGIDSAVVRRAAASAERALRQAGRRPGLLRCTPMSAVTFCTRG